MNLFQHDIWQELAPYAHVTYYGPIIRLDFLQLPDELRSRALAVSLPCIACGALVHPLRARALSSRARISGTEVEHRLFYGPTCLKETNIGCSRTTAVRDHKQMMRSLLDASSAHV